MSLLSWNCRGLGNPATVQVLVDLVHSKKPDVVFLIETLVGLNKMQPIKTKLGFKGLFCRGKCRTQWRVGPILV